MFGRGGLLLVFTSFFFSILPHSTYQHGGFLLLWLSALFRWVVFQGGGGLASASACAGVAGRLQSNMLGALPYKSETRVAKIALFSCASVTNPRAIPTGGASLHS